MKLRGRLLVSYLLVVVVCLGLAGVLTSYTLEELARENLEAARTAVDEITEVTNLAKERERARREQKKDGWFANAVKDAARPFITLIIVAAMAVGTSLAVTQCGGQTIDRATIEEQRHVLEKVEKQLRKVNGGER